MPIKLIICDQKDLPAHDARAVQQAAGKTLLLEGLIVPRRYRLGTFPLALFTPGSVAIIAQDKGAAYEAAYETTKQGLGQSFCCVIGKQDEKPFAELAKSLPATQKVMVI